MTNFIETQKNASKELAWLINSAKVTTQYDECVEKKYVGKLPYTMVMKVIKNNTFMDCTIYECRVNLPIKNRFSRVHIL